jgi:hypothetical protein
MKSCTTGRVKRVVWSGLSAFRRTEVKGTCISLNITAHRRIYQIEALYFILRNTTFEMIRGSNLGMSHSEEYYEI